MLLPIRWRYLCSSLAVALAVQSGALAQGFGASPNPNDSGESEYAVPGERSGCVQRPTITDEIADLVTGVYPFSGETFRVEEDMVVRGRVMDFKFIRKYRSQAGLDSPVGHRWDFSYNISLAADGRDVKVRNGFARADVYRLSAPNRWTNESFFRILERNGDGSFSLLFSDGGSWNLNPLNGAPAAGKIKSIVDRNGNTMSFEYDSAGRLVTIRDDLDRPYAIKYTAAGRIQSVCDFTARCWTYEYYAPGDAGGMPGDLKSVTTPRIVGTPNGNDFPAGRTVTYTYTQGNTDDRLNHLLATVSNARGTVFLKNEYDTTSAPNRLTFGRLTRQRWGGDDDIIDLVYARVTPGAANNLASLRVIMNMRDGAVKEAFYNAANRGVMYREYIGFADPDAPTTATVNRPGPPLRPADAKFFEHRWSYAASGVVRSVTFPSGASIIRTHDENNPDPRARGNLLKLRRLAGPLGADQAEFVESFEYLAGRGSCCGLSFVTRHVDARGNTISYSYDSEGNRVRAVGPEPAAVNEWEYDDFGRVIASIDADDGQGRRRRDERAYYTEGPIRGYLKSVTTDAAGFALTTTYEYNSLGHMVRAIDAAGNSTSAFPNALGEVVREVSRPMDSSGTRSTKDRFLDADGNLMRVERENRDYTGALAENDHFTTSYTYDALGRTVSMTREIDATRSLSEEYQYNPNGLPQIIRSGEAVNGNQPDNIVTRVYDERGKLYQEIVKDGAVRLTAQRDYNPDGYLTRVIDNVGPAQRETVLVIDGYGRTREVIDPMGNRRTFTYDANWNKTLVQHFGELKDAPGSARNVLLYRQRGEFDAANRPVKTVAEQFEPATGRPVGDTVKESKWNYAANGALRNRVTPDGGTFEVRRDTAGRTSVELSPSGVERRYAYDSLSKVTRIDIRHASETGGTPVVLSTRYAYRPDGKLMQVTNSDGGIWRFGYDSRENRTHVVDPRGNVADYIVDGAHRVIEERRNLTNTGDGSGKVTGAITVRRVYDDSHRAVQRIDGLGRVTTYQWDSLNRLVQTTHADGSKVSRAYNASGELAQITDANCSVVTHAYDRMGRLVRRDIAPGPGVSSATTFETFAYDGMGNLVSAANDQTAVARAYDSLGNLVADAIDGVSVACNVESGGSPLHCDYPSGKSFDYSYRPDGRAATIRHANSLVAEFNYLGGLGVERVRYPDVPGPAFIDESSTYDAAGRLSRLSVALDNGTGQKTLLDDRSFLWDVAGNRTRVADTLPGHTNSHEYAYDSASRLIRSQSDNGAGHVDVSYTLDAAGNRTTVSGGQDAGAYTVDALHQYTQTSFDARSYDAAGNTKAVQATGANIEMTWNYKNELVRWHNTANGKTVTYRYDALGRPVLRAEAGAGANTTRFRWFGDGLVEEHNTTAGTINSYAHAAGDIRVLINNGGIHYLHPDRSATVFAVTSQSGALAARYDYDAFGARRDLINPLVFQNRSFAGFWLDDDLNYYRAGHRFYEPRTGKFVSRDPLGVWGDRASFGNGSLYAAANPWSRRDPTGLAVECGDFGTPDEWMCYEFDACTSGDEDDVHDWIIGRTLAGVEDAEWYVHDGDEDSYLLEVWFDGHTGDVDADEYDTIHTEMFTVEDYMEDSTLTFECEYNGGWSNWCNDEDDGGRGYAAYVYIPDKVHLCDRYFDNKTDWDVPDSYASDSDQSTYYHELNHAKHWWTDQGYYTSGSASDGQPNYDTGIGADQVKLRKNPDTYSSMAELGISLDQATGYFSPY